MAYGIANRSGKVSSVQVAQILSRARLGGIDTLDTAIGYGDAERRLGLAGVDDWKVVTKLAPDVDDSRGVSTWVRQSVRESLERLRIPKLHGLLLHRPEQLLGDHGKELYRALLQVKTNGQVTKIGVSVCDPEELQQLWPRFDLDLVQAPLSIVDRRLVRSGWLSRLSESGVEVHVRSVFLQGLLLMEAETRPTWFRQWNGIWERWDRWLEQRQIAPIDGALGFALSQIGVSRVVVGVDSVDQLEDALSVGELGLAELPPGLESSDPALVNPSQWRSD